MSPDQAVAEQILYGSMQRSEEDAARKAVLDKLDQLDAAREITQEIVALRRIDERPNIKELHDLNNRWWNEALLPNARRATAEEYQEWLSEWDKAGRISTSEDPPEEPEGDFDAYFDGFYVATDTLVVCPQYGGDAYNLIIPEGIQVEIHSGDPNPDFMLGHSNLFWQDGYRHQGDSVTMYNNAKV